MSSPARHGEDPEPDDTTHRPPTTSDDHTAQRTISRSTVSHGTSIPAQAAASLHRSRTLRGDDPRDDDDPPRPQHKAKEDPSQHAIAIYIRTSTNKENAATAKTGLLRTEEQPGNSSGAHTYGKWRGRNHVEGPENPTRGPNKGTQQQTTNPSTRTHPTIRRDARALPGQCPKPRTLSISNHTYTNQGCAPPMSTRTVDPHGREPCDPRAHARATPPHHMTTSPASVFKIKHDTGRKMRSSRGGEPPPIAHHPRPETSCRQPQRARATGSIGITSVWKSHPNANGQNKVQGLATSRPKGKSMCS
jgi:hypothetical protein